MNDADTVIPMDREPPAPAPTESPKRRNPLIVVAVVIAAIVLIATQYLLISALFDTQNELDNVVDQLQDLTDSVGEVQGGLGSVEESLGQVEGGLAEVDDRVRALQDGPFGFSDGPIADESSAAPEPTLTVTRALPRFGGNSGADPAVGMDVGLVTGIEYYSGESVSYQPDAGLARAIFVWAHWCPYCQQEIPVITDRYDGWAEQYPNVEIVSITTAMDASRGNPLGDYLDTGQFPFPVIVDGDGALSAHLGVNAFPFWVFSGPDGSVLGRTAGLLSEATLDDILRQLNEIAASA